MGARGLSLVVVGLLFALLGGGAGCVRSAPPPATAKLRVIAVPDTTTVYIGDRYVGSARVLASTPKKLAPGVKYITFQAPGYFPHDVRLDLPSGLTTVEIKLRKVPL